MAAHILSCHDGSLVWQDEMCAVARQDVQPFACVYMAALDLCVRGSLSQVLVKYFPQQNEWVPKPKTRRATP